MSLCPFLKEKLTKVNEILATHESFREKIKNAKTSKDLKELENAWREFKRQTDLPLSENIKELGEIREVIKNLEKDYEESLEVLDFYEILPKGQTSYQADFKGKKRGEDFSREHFEIPTLEEIIQKLTPEKIKAYQYLDKVEGVAPKLQLTPIGLTIQSLASKFNGKVDKLKEKWKFTTYEIEIYQKEVDDSKLKYDPESFDVSDPEKFVAVKGKSKAQIVKENKGWMIDIVATKPVLAPDESIQKTDDKSGNRTYAEQTAQYQEKYKNLWITGLSYESFLISQMRALKTLGVPLDKWDGINATFTTLPNSSTQNSSLVSHGYWLNNSVNLSHGKASTQWYDLRFRPAVRV